MVTSNDGLSEADAHPRPLFRGLIVPMLTPLTVDEELDEAGLRGTIEFLCSAGCDGLFILGSNGEGAMLRSAIRLAVARSACAIAAGRTPVICGVLETSTARVIEEVAALEAIDVAGYVVTTPLYFDGFNDDDLFRHFSRIAAATARPVLIYNIPQYATCPVSASLARRLAAIPNIVGLKDSSGNWEDFAELMTDRPKPDFALLQGHHGLAAASLLGGADGLVPGYANLRPRLFADMLQAASIGDEQRCNELQVQLDQLLSFRGRAAVHANKVVAKALGLMDDVVSSPLPVLDEASAKQLVIEVLAAGLPGAER